MATQAQIDANRRNAKRSTGPRTLEGKLRAAHNASKHNLQASPTTIFENDPIKRSQFENLKHELTLQVRPEGTLEVETLDRYAFALFQVNTARQLILDAESRWLEQPENETWFRQYERLQQLSALHERRADKALAELRKLQADRFASQDIANEIYLLDRFAPIPATLPVSSLRRSFSAFQLAAQIITNEPDCQAILTGRAPSEPRGAVRCD